MTEFNHLRGKKEKYIDRKMSLPIGGKVKALPSVEIPKVMLPNMKKKDLSTDKQIADIKKKLFQGEISEEEYQQQIQKIIENV